MYKTKNWPLLLVLISRVTSIYVNSKIYIIIHVFHRLQTGMSTSVIVWLYWTLKVKTHTAHLPEHEKRYPPKRQKGRCNIRKESVWQRPSQWAVIIRGMPGLTAKQCTSHMLFPQRKSPLTARHVSSPWTPVLLFTHALTLPCLYSKTENICQGTPSRPS